MLNNAKCMINDYNALAQSYAQTNQKPDKQFSTLPTVLSIAGEVSGKTVLDLGCGSGFFTESFAELPAKKVIGIDNSTEQLALANARKSSGKIDYFSGNIFSDPLPFADITIAAYVLNYAANVLQLKKFLKRIHKALNEKGVLIGVVDLPDGKDLRKFGAIKKVLGKKQDGAKIKIELFSHTQYICALDAFYFSPATIEKALKYAGFTNIQWHSPILSEVGILKYGENFWQGYAQSPELGYISAMKVTK